MVKLVVEQEFDIAGRFRCVRVGYWVHFRDSHTGECWWQWEPPRPWAMPGHLFADPVPQRE